MHPLIIEWQIASALLWSSPWRRNFTNCLESVAFSGPKFFNFIFLLRCSRLTKWTWQTVQDDAMWLKFFFVHLLSFIIVGPFETKYQVILWRPNLAFVVAIYGQCQITTLLSFFSCDIYIHVKLIINHSFNEIALRFLQEMQYSLPNPNQIQVLL